jgi:HD-GYP domain-containing protein (c-di-GMP phosphodiesterase class II)
MFMAFGLVQVAVFHAMLRLCHREQASHIEAMAALAVAVQPSDIAEHSRRVATISEMLAREMRLPSDRMPIVRAAGLLHQIDGIEHIPGQVQIHSEIVAVADYFDESIHISGSTLDNTIDDIWMEVGNRFHPDVVRALMRLACRGGLGEARE